MYENKETLNNIVEEMVPTYFSFNAQLKSVTFVYNGSLISCHSRAQFKAHTFARLVSGLNHFLVYWYNTDKDVYNKICSHLFYGIINAYNAFKDIQTVKEVTNAERIEALKNYSIPSLDLCYYIVEYVEACSDNVIDESLSTTEVTLTNFDAKILASISVAVKVNYLYSGLLRGDITFDKTIEFTIDLLLNRIIEAINKFYATKNTIDQQSIIDSYIIGLIGRIFNKRAKSSFKRKLEEFGSDVVKISSVHRSSIIASLRSYFVKLKDRETAIKYSINKDSKAEIDDKMSNMYYTIGFTSYKDFSFNSLNMAAFMNITLEKSIKAISFSESLPDVNINDFLIDANDEKSNKREISYFDDKRKHLYNLRKDTMVDTISQFIDELRMDKVDINFLNFMKYFKLTKKHPFNTFIEYKILLCLTGEAKTYYKTIGNYGKLILALFFYKVKSNPSLIEFHSLVDIMVQDASDVPTIKEDYLKTILEENGLLDPKYIKSLPIFVMYTTPNTNSTYVIEPNMFCNFLKFVEDPKNIIKLLFPNTTQTISSELLKYDNAYKVHMDKAKPEVKEKAFKYLFNKRGY